MFNSVDAASEALIKAIAANDSVKVNDCLIAGARINYVNRFGETALHHACSQKDMVLIKRLLELGSDVSVKTSSGISCYDIASQCHSHEMKTLLKQYEQFVLIKDNPYRILGVYPNEKIKFFSSQKTKAIAFLKAKKHIDYERDLKLLLPSVLRTEENINDAFQKLHSMEEKIRYALFWFIEADSFDSIALQYVVAGNTEKAKSIWSKKTTFSSLNNLSTLAFILGDYQAAFLSKFDMIQGVSINNSLEQFITSVTDEYNIIDQKAVEQLFIDTVLQFVIKQCGVVRVWKLMESSSNNVKVHQYVYGKLSQVLNLQLVNLMKQSELSNKERPLSALKHAITLSREAKLLLQQFYGISAKHIGAYEVISDKIALQIFECLSIYVEHTSFDSLAVAEETIWILDSVCDIACDPKIKKDSANIRANVALIDCCIKAKKSRTKIKRRVLCVICIVFFGSIFFFSGEKDEDIRQSSKPKKTHSNSRGGASNITSGNGKRSLNDSETIITPSVLESMESLLKSKNTYSNAKARASDITQGDERSALDGDQPKTIIPQTQQGSISPAKTTQISYAGNSLNSGETPYANVCGEGVFDRKSECYLEFENRTDLDVIVVLKNKAKQIIRHAYIRSYSSFKFLNLPLGTCYASYIYGKDWNPTRLILKGKFRGAFDTSLETLTSSDAYKMEQDKRSYSTGTVTLSIVRRNYSYGSKDTTPVSLDTVLSEL